MPEKFKGELSREEDYVDVTSSEPYEGFQSAKTMEDFEKQVELFKEKYGVEPKFLVELRKGCLNRIGFEVKRDLVYSKTIGFFEMRAKALKGKYGVELPKNIEELRKKCLTRNKEIFGS